MSRKIITISEIIELNQVLSNKGLQFKVHLHDACGRQSFHVEALEECDKEEVLDKMQAEITAYFQEKNVGIRFLDNSFNFIISE